MYDFDFNNFDKLFDFPQERWFTYILLCCKFYIYCCKFQNDTLYALRAYKSCLITKRYLEYNLAKKNGKLSLHFKKWCFDLN